MSSGGDKTSIPKTHIPTVTAIRGDDIWTKVKSKASESALMAASSLLPNGYHYTKNTLLIQGPNDTMSSDKSLYPEGVTSYPIKEFGPDGEVIIAYEHHVEIWDWRPSLYDVSRSGVTDDKMLYLISSTGSFDGYIELVAPLSFCRVFHTYRLLIGYKKGDDHIFLSVVLDRKNKMENMKRSEILLQSSLKDSAPYHCKVASTEFCLISNTGEMCLFPKFYTSPVPTLKISCKVINNTPVCDIQGNWMIYNPSQQDPFYKEIVMDSEKYPLTPLDLPRPGPLLNRVLKNLSSTAIDSIFKIAEISHSKIKGYMNLSNVEDDPAKTRNLRDAITKILNALNETSSRQYLILMDLRLKKPMFVFSPPGGCSMVSLSPADMLLSSVTLRGDDIFIWDFTKFNREISLIEKFRRGKTPGVVDQIIWGDREEYVGVLSRLNGSLHWFQNNLLNDYQENENWTISSFGLKKLKLFKNEILAFDNKNNLKIVQTNGICNSMFILPQKPLPKSEMPEYLINVDDTKRQSSDTIVKKTTDNSKVELDYTRPYDFYYKNRKVEFYTWDSTDLNDSSTKINNKDLTKIDFGRASGVAIFHDEKDAINILLNE